MRTGLLFFASGLLLATPLSASAETLALTSQNLRSLIESKSPLVAAAKLEVDAAEEREGSFARSFLPTFELYGSRESSRYGSSAADTGMVLGLEAQANLYNGSRDGIEDSLRRLETQKRQFKVRKAISEHLDKASTLYWQIVYCREKSTLLTKALEVNRRNLSSARRRISSGVATDSDRFEFEMKEVNLKREIAQNDVESRIQIRLLQTAIGLSETVDLRFSEPLTHDHQYERSLKYSGDHYAYLFRDAEIQSEQQLLLADIHRRAQLPRLEVFGGYKRYKDDTETFGAESRDEVRQDTEIGLRLTMDLADGFGSKKEAASLFVEARASKAVIEQLKRELDAHLHGEIAQLRVLHDQVHEAENNIERDETYYEMTQSEYARGVKNSPDVLGASEKLFDMRHKYIEVIRDFQIARAHVLAKIGS